MKRKTTSPKLKTFKVQLDNVLVKDLNAISELSSLSHEQVLTEIIEYVLDSGKITRKVFAPRMRRAKAACSGSCRGKGRTFRLVPGKCPDPCDKAILDALADTAKKDARLDAIANCMVAGGADCLCTEGTYIERYRRCETTTREDGTQECLYKVSYRYEDGTCKVVA